MKNEKMQAIAVERIYRLFELAEQELEKNPDRSKRYISIAREIGKKHTIRFPKELKSKFCKKCSAFLKEGKNSEISIKGEITSIKCLECNSERKMSTK